MFCRLNFRSSRPIRKNRKHYAPREFGAVQECMSHHSWCAPDSSCVNTCTCTWAYIAGSSGLTINRFLRMLKLWCQTCGTAFFSALSWVPFIVVCPGFYWDVLIEISTVRLVIVNKALSWVLVTTNSCLIRYHHLRDLSCYLRHNTWRNVFWVYCCKWNNSCTCSIVTHLNAYTYNTQQYGATPICHSGFTSFASVGIHVVGRVFLLCRWLCWFAISMHGTACV